MRRSLRFAPSMPVSWIEHREAPAGVAQQVGVVLNLYAGAGESDFAVRYSEDRSRLVVTTDGVESSYDAAAILFVKFYGSPDGADAFVNDTDKMSLSIVSHADTFVRGGTGLDTFVDFSGGATFEDR